MKIKQIKFRNFFKIKLIRAFTPLHEIKPIFCDNSSPRTRSQDLLVPHYACEDNQFTPLHKYTINQVTQNEPEPEAVKTTNLIAKLYTEARARLETYGNFTKFKQKKKRDRESF